MSYLISLVIIRISDAARFDRIFWSVSFLGVFRSLLPTPPSSVYYGCHQHVVPTPARIVSDRSMVLPFLFGVDDLKANFSVTRLREASIPLSRRRYALARDRDSKERPFANKCDTRCNISRHHKSRRRIADVSRHGQLPLPYRYLSISLQGREWRITSC